MIVVVAKFTVKPEKKVELLALAKELIADTLLEAGCISYTLLEDPYSDGGMVFLEEWADKQALERHFTTSHIADWKQKSADLKQGSAVITLYQAEPTRL